MNEKEEKELGKLVNKLDKIFIPLNKTVCVSCDCCCCKYCKENKGFFHDLGIFKERKKKFAFDKEKGFLTEKGCSIPRGLRSSTCLRFVCRKMELIDLKRIRFHVRKIYGLYDDVQAIVNKIIEIRGY